MSLQEVFIEELRDLYSAENQLVKALPRMAKAASTPELKTLITEHLDETRSQVERLKQVFQQLSKKPTGQHCNGMEGLITEGKEAIESREEGAPKDIHLIGAALRIEHYEIAGYTAVINIAKALGQKDIAVLLKETLEEEKNAGTNLLSESRPILSEASSGAGSAQEQQEEEDDELRGAEQAESKRRGAVDERAAVPELKKSA